MLFPPLILDSLLLLVIRVAVPADYSIIEVSYADIPFVIILPVCIYHCSQHQELLIGFFLLVQHAAQALFSITLFQFIIKVSSVEPVV